MMGWRDMYNIRVTFFQFIYDDTALVHRDVIAGHLMSGIDLIDFIIARIFHGIFFVKTQKLDQQSVQIFRSGTDNDLFRLNVKIAVALQMVCDRLTQFQDSSAGRICYQLFLILV